MTQRFRCLHCAKRIPCDANEGTWEYEEVCSAACFLQEFITTAGTEGVSTGECITARKAVRELENQQRGIRI